MMRKKLLMVGLMLSMLCCTTACGKRIGGTINEGLPENVQAIFDNSLKMDEQLSTELNEIEKLFDGITIA